jgi:hypothetical protein
MMFRIFLAAVALLALLAACGESGQETRSPAPASDTPTAPPAAETPTAEPSEETPVATEPPGGAGGGGDGTVVPVTTPFPTPPPVAADWVTHSQPASERSPAFDFSYPASWVMQGGETTGPGVGVSITLWSWDPNTWSRPYFPPNSIKVGLSAAPEDILSYCEPRGAAPATVAGIEGWQIVYSYDDPSKSNGVTRAHEVGVLHNGYCFVIGGNFAQENPDETTFLQIANSFRFSE